MNADAEIIGLLREISGKLDALIGNRGAGLTRADRELLERLLPAVSFALGNGPFTISDLQGYAIHDAELAAVLAKAPRSKSLGKVFARAAGLRIDGFLVTRVAKGRDGIVWAVTL